MSDGQVLKPDKDFSKEVDKQLPEAESLALVFYFDLTVFALKADTSPLADKCARSYREAHGVRETDQTGKPHISLRPPHNNDTLRRHRIWHPPLEFSLR